MSSKQVTGRAEVRATRNVQSEVLRVARENFGFEELRAGQLEAIESLVGGRDTLVVKPTGSGKSAIYQIAGLMMRGSVLVISPLIALQKDQVDSINGSEGSAEAVVINSALKTTEFRRNLERLAEGFCKFVFLAPEQLPKGEAIEALRQSGISLMVIDEAHCISQWGHDFRPDYLQIGRVIESLGHPVTLGMTATATNAVREEIIERLGLKDPYVFVGGFDRPNIHLRVDHFDNKDEKMDALLHKVRWAEKPGIVYVATRKTAELVMHGVKEQGVGALFYHGGLNGSERTDIQDQFMSGDADVIVATNAFGMGIDKQNIRFVYHHDAPDSLDAYYQEIGRAGRDGEPAEAILFFRKEDIGVQAFHTGSGKIKTDDLTRMAGVLEKEESPLSAEEIAEKAGFSTRKVTAALQRLEEADAIEMLPSGEAQLKEQINWDEATQRVAERDEQRKQANKERLRQMQAYAETTDCRRSQLLRYFGDEFEGPCHNCDNCGAEHPRASVDPGVATRREVA